MESISTVRMLHTATLPKDRRVPTVGGTSRSGNIAKAEMYDLSTEVWAPAGAMAHQRALHTATLLQDGRVLVVGGTGTATEIYDPGTGAWSSGGP